MPDSAPGLQSAKPRRSRFRRFLRAAVLCLGGVALVLLVAVLVWLRGALYNRFVRFPREAAAWRELRAQVHPVPRSGWNEFRGILHSHSEISHDSEVTPQEILRVLKETGIDFICLSDHCVDGRADFDVQWRGLHEGKLFVPGFEMRDGLMPFGAKRGTVLSNSTAPATLAKEATASGALLFYAHPEEKRDWDCPELNGMEIYNIHTDVKRMRAPFKKLLPDLLLNMQRYPDHVWRLVFHRPTEFLQRWDALNQTRHITGIAANDCHQNTGFRLLCISQDLLRFEDTSPKTIKEIRLNGLTRPVARFMFGALEPGRKLFHAQVDPYERMSRFVNTHVLAERLSESSILDSLRAGRVFVAFDMIVDSHGFQWRAKSDSGEAVMGESHPLSASSRLYAASPVPCRFTILRNGAAAYVAEGRDLAWAPPGPGVYRVEAEVKLRGEWVPWVYANPIWIE